MTDAPNSPELAAAITKFAVIEGVLLVVGMLLFVVFDTIWGLVGAMALGSVVFFVLVMRPLLERKRDGE